MSHITQQSERDENQAIDNCPYRSVYEYVDVYNDWTGETEQEWKQVSKCGDMQRVSLAKDKCTRCGKVFTY
jgi:hypothetical protein